MTYLSTYLPENYSPEMDCTEYFCQALKETKGILHITPGVYLVNDIEIPDDTILEGEGNTTVIKSAGSNTIFRLKGKKGWSIRNLKIEGTIADKSPENSGFKAISIESCWSFDIARVSICNCDGIGIDILETPLTKEKAAYCDGGNLSQITLKNNFTGIRFDQHAEYINAIQINAYNNVTGCIIHAGNVKIANSNFCNNYNGMLIKDKPNGSHGSISNCLFNHNENCALKAVDIRYGMAISGCCFYYGKIEFDNCRGVNISNGQISCDIAITGNAKNQIINNYIIPENWNFKIAEPTLLSGNFTDNDTWQPNI